MGHRFTRPLDRRSSDQQARLDRHPDDLLVLSPLGAMEATLVVTIDQARVVNVPAGTEALIVGNAAIADLTLLKQGATMIITGKGFGETNFIALDIAGNPLAQSLIRVVGGRNALLVQRGMGRESYACGRNVCQP